MNWPPSRLRGQCPGARTSYSSSTEIEVDDEEEEDEEDDASKGTEDEMLAQDDVCVVILVKLSESVTVRVHVSFGRQVNASSAAATGSNVWTFFGGGALPGRS